MRHIIKKTKKSLKKHKISGGFEEMLIILEVDKAKVYHSMGYGVSKLLFVLDDY